MKRSLSKTTRKEADQKLKMKECHDKVQFDCDTLAKNISIVHQNEYILQNFRKKEKETKEAYECIVKD